MSVRHLSKISDLSRIEILEIISLAHQIKAHPQRYRKALKNKTLLMLFEKPSLRTRVSFETGMTQLGGHAIFYSTADSPLGKKETISDTAKVLSRMVDIVMARVMSRNQIRGLISNSTIPIINALDDFAHPCQMLADLQTIHEVKGEAPITFCYCGDLKNNVTYDLMRLGAIMGWDTRVAGPAGPEYDVEEEVLQECAALCANSGGSVRVFHEAIPAITGADVVYCDSWMSYGVSAATRAERFEKFGPFRVDAELFSHAKPDAIFMNCLPAERGAEQTAEVIDGDHSVVFQEAENRLHAQKALMLFLLNVNTQNC